MGGGEELEEEGEWRSSCSDANSSPLLSAVLDRLLHDLMAAHWDRQVMILEEIVALSWRMSWFRAARNYERKNDYSSTLLSKCKFTCFSMVERQGHRKPSSGARQETTKCSTKPTK